MSTFETYKKQKTTVNLFFNCKFQLRDNFVHAQQIQSVFCFECTFTKFILVTS